MSAKYLIPAVLASLLASAANAAPAADPVRARVVAELEQARADGSYPPSEADYVYPNWVRIANPAGVVMSDGHPELENRKPASSRTAAVPARPTAADAPAVALMTDASSGAANARTGKGSDSAQ